MQGKLGKFFALALVSALFAFTLTAGKASADEADVKYRQAVMKSLGGHMASVVAIVKGQVDHKDHLAAHADAIAGMGKIVKDIFPEGSDMAADTKALPAIWEKPDDFAKAVAAFETASANLAKAADSGDMAAVGAALGPLGQSCGGCHKPFRQ